MKRSVKVTYLLAAVYGVAMVAAGVDPTQPAFWIGSTYGLLVGLNEHFWGGK